MSKAQTWKLRSRVVTPPGGTTNIALFNVEAGVRVISASMRILVAAAGGSVAYGVGDGTDVDGYITDADMAETAAGLKNGTGAFLVTAGGKLYTADDTIDLDIVQTTVHTTQPQLYVTATFRREEP